MRHYPRNGRPAQVGAWLDPTTFLKLWRRHHGGYLQIEPVVFFSALGSLAGLAILSNLPPRPRGIALSVFGIAIGIWAYTRVTSVIGQLHTWAPPFSEYETITLAGAGVSLIAIVWGFTSLSSRSPSRNSAESPVQSGSRFCRHCAAAIAVTDAFCEACGHAVAGREPT